MPLCQISALHMYANAVDPPLSALDEGVLCPGGAALDKINAPSR